MRRLTHRVGMGMLLGLLAIGGVQAQGVPEPGIVLYGKVWSTAGLVVAGSLTWRYTPSTGASVELTVALEEIVTPAGEHFSYRASIPAESVEPGYPSASNVLPATEATVLYTRSAFVDGAPATIAGGRTTDTFSADERGKVERVDLAVGGAPIPVGGIAGTVTSAGRQAGPVVVQLSVDPAFTGVPERRTEATPIRSGTWQYAFADLPAGAYYIRAFRDTDGNGLPDSMEAQGTYALNPAQLPPELSAADIVLVDADNDHDGLPDWWEALRPGGLASGFGADDDGDGAWNGLEYAAGTNPDDKDSAPGPVAWWRLDHGAGVTATDASGHSHDGTLAHGPTWGTGIRGGALQFDGVDDQVTVPAASDLNLTDGLTLQAWIRHDVTGTRGGRILSKYDDTLDAGYSLGVSSADGRLELRLGDSFSVVSTGVIAAGRWVHVAATLDLGAGTVTFYLDGRPDSTHPDADPCTTTALDLCIGNSASGALPFAGAIDEPKLFAYARSAAAIAADAFAITAFAIADGAAATNQRTVTLNNVCGGVPLDYLASERTDFADATWQPYATAPTFTLSAGDGAKTVYLRVRSANDEWGPLADAIAMDAAAPTVIAVDAATPDGVYGSGSIIAITIAFSEPVMVTGTPRLSLETGTVDGTTDYVAGSGTAVLEFRYTVGAGQASADLDYTGPGALSPNGGSVRDIAGNEADLALPAPGATHSLGANCAIAVGNVHTVTYQAGAHGRIDGIRLQHVVDGGTTAAVTAVADACHVFTQWSDGGTRNPRQDTNVTADLTLTASFRDAIPVAPDGRFVALVDAAAVTTGQGWWDLSGTYRTTANGQPLTLDLLHDAAGRISGLATYTIAGGTPVNLPIKGGVRGTSGSITMRGSLAGTDPAGTTAVSLGLDLTVDTAHRQLVGHLSGSVQANAVTTPVQEDLTLPIPTPMDGTWTLRLQLGHDGRTVTGTALLTLANGVDYAFVVRGRTRGAEAVLSLAGNPSDPASKAIAIRTTITPLEGGGARLESFSGRGYGQTLGW